MELAERLSQAAAAQGILAAALPDAVARGTQHFTLPPTDRELADWAASLQVTAPHFFAPPPSAPDAEGTPPGLPPSVWKSMAPSSKLTWLREHGHAPSVVQRRPQPLTLSAEQAAALATLPAQQRLDAYRQLQREQQKG